MDEVTEDELVAAAEAGATVESEEAGSRRTLDAALLRKCCQRTINLIDPRGIRLRRISVAGPLDLSGLQIPYPLVFDECGFDAPLLAEGATIYELSLLRCAGVPGLLANGVRVQRDLNLSGSSLTGAHATTASTSRKAAVWLCESRIGGRLLCVDTSIDALGERAIQADRMEVTGNVRLIHDFNALGEVRLIGARINGSLDLTGVRIEGTPTGLALDLGEAVIQGSVFLITTPSGRSPVIRGRIDMGRARITGQLLIRGVTLDAERGEPVGSAYSRYRRSGTALSAPRLSVGAETSFDDSCTVLGGIDFSMSELSSLAIGPGSSLHAPGRRALDLTNAELLSTLTIGAGVPVEGTVRLTGARIHGNLCLRGVKLREPENIYLLAAHGATIDGEVELQALKATGGAIGFRAATIGSVVDATGAELTNPVGYTLSLHQANVRGSVRLVDRFTSDGLLVLNRATIEGRLLCTNGTFTCSGPGDRNESGHAIEAISATIRGGMDLGWTSVSPSVDFTNATTSFLADDPANWPSAITISGFTYDRFDKPQSRSSSWPWDPKIRRAWLSRQVTYDAGPYEQAAQVFRQHGYADNGKTILIAKHKDARATLRGPWAVPRRLLNVAYGMTVGYGYRPGRVLWLLALLVALVTASLQIPAAQAAMRATVTGYVYTTNGAVGKVPLSPSAATNPLVQRAARCGGGDVRCFNSFLYAFDTVIPLVSLGQRSTWYPYAQAPYGTLMQWWLDAASVLGWLLSSVFVLSLAGLARSP